MGVIFIKLWSLRSKVQVVYSVVGALKSKGYVCSVFIAWKYGVFCWIPAISLNGEEELHDTCSELSDMAWYFYTLESGFISYSACVMAGDKGGFQVVFELYNLWHYHNLAWNLHKYVNVKLGKMIEFWSELSNKECCWSLLNARNYRIKDCIIFFDKTSCWRNSVTENPVYRNCKRILAIWSTVFFRI